MTDEYTCMVHTWKVCTIKLSLFRDFFEINGGLNFLIFRMILMGRRFEKYTILVSFFSKFLYIDLLFFLNRSFAWKLERVHFTCTIYWCKNNRNFWNKFRDRKLFYYYNTSPFSSDQCAGITGIRFQLLWILTVIILC